MERNGDGVEPGELFKCDVSLFSQAYINQFKSVMESDRKADSDARAALFANEAKKVLQIAYQQNQTQLSVDETLDRLAKVSWTASLT